MSDNMIGDLLDIKYSIEGMETSEIDKKNKIISKINVFLLLHCNHVIVCDYIDITPDKGCNIKYCEKCHSTFAPLKI